MDGWLVYQNDLLGYEISYPPQASISSLGPDGYLADDVPQDEAFDSKAFDYFALLEDIYPDDLCVAIGYEMGFVDIRAPLNRGGNFITGCGVTGIGDDDVIRIVETIFIDGRPYSATGYEVHNRDSTATFRREFLWTQLEDGTRIEYGGGGATYEDYLSVKEVLKQIVASYHRTSAEPSCGSNWSQLYPGLFARVTGGPGDPLNRVRSAPDTSADIIARINPGQVVIILEGPACVGSLVFWKVQSDAIPGGQGWTAEGDGIEYYLVPYKR